MHSLRISHSMKTRWSTERNPKPLVDWAPEMASQKRKRQDKDRQDLRPPKRAKSPLQIEGRNLQCPDPSLGRKTPNKAQATTSPESSETSTTHAASDDDSQDLPELIHSELTSPSDTGVLHSRTDLCLSQDVLQKELHSELKWLQSLPETNPDEQRPPLRGEDVLFSQFLRSRSPSCFSAQGSASNHDGDGRTCPPTITPSDTYHRAEEDSHLADLIDQNTAKPKNVPVKTTKPRITLRIRQPALGPKPKVLLRLSQPKQVPAQKSLLPGIKKHGRRRTRK